MATFLVLRQLPGLTRDQYAAAQQAASEAARQASIGGRVVRHLGGFFIPGKGRAICIFCAESLADVTRSTSGQECRSPKSSKQSNCGQGTRHECRQPALSGMQPQLNAMHEASEGAVIPRSTEPA